MLPCYNELMGDEEKKEVGYFKVTDRPLGDYERIFSFRAEDLKPNSKVLDVGSGLRQTFAKELQQKRPDIQVVSFDPTLFLKKYDLDTEEGTRKASEEEKKQKLRRKEKFGEVIASIFPETPHLPFKDESFDYVIDNHGPFMYFEDHFSELKDYINELLRILKPQGQAFIYPLDLIADILKGLNDEEKYQRSENRILAIMGQVGREIGLSHKTFTFTEGTPEKPLIKLGIKITKNLPANP